MEQRLQPPVRSRARSAKGSAAEAETHHDRKKRGVRVSAYFVVRGAACRILGGPRSGADFADFADVATFATFHRRNPRDPPGPADVPWRHRPLDGADRRNVAEPRLVAQSVPRELRRPPGTHRHLAGRYYRSLRDQQSNR